MLLLGVRQIRRGYASKEIETATQETATFFQVQRSVGKWHLVRLRPYRTLENRIEGVVIVFIDIDSLKRDQDTLRRQAELLEHASEPTLMRELGGAIVYWNKAAERLYGYTREEALDRRGHELLATTPGPDDIDDALRKHGWWAGKVVHTLRDRTQIAVHSRMVMLRERDGKSFVIEAHQPMPRDSH